MGESRLLLAVGGLQEQTEAGVSAALRGNLLVLQEPLASDLLDLHAGLQVWRDGRQSRDGFENLLDELGAGRAGFVVGWWHRSPSRFEMASHSVRDVHRPWREKPDVTPRADVSGDIFGCFVQSEGKTAVNGCQDCLDAGRTSAKNRDSRFLHG
jgi:hypothetical protein